MRFEVIAPPFVEVLIHPRVPPDQRVKHAFASRDLPREWRFAALAGVTTGLAVVPAAPPDPALAAAGAIPIAVIALSALRPHPGSAAGMGLAWLAVVATAGALAGLLAGGARLHAID